MPYAPKMQDPTSRCGGRRLAKAGNGEKGQVGAGTGAWRTLGNVVTGGATVQARSSPSGVSQW